MAHAIRDGPRTDEFEVIDMRDGIEAGTGETEGLDAKRESPVTRSGTRPNPCFTTPNPILEGVELREAYARIISPEWFGEKDGVHVLDNRAGQHLEYRARALAKADAILALKATPLIGLSQGEGNQRRHVMPGDPHDLGNTALQWYLDFQFGYPHSVRESNIAVEAFKDGFRAALSGLSLPGRGAGLREALIEARDVLAVYADPTGYTDNDGEQLSADETVHPGLLAKGAVAQIEAALSALPQSGYKI